MAGYFLKIDGIEGESQDQRHPGEIEVESFSWGEAHPASAGAPAADKANIQDLQVMKRMDKASPLLMLAATSGQRFTSAVLTAQTPGTAPLEFLTITLSDLMVSSYQTAGSASDPVPVDQVSFSFGRIDIAYWPKRPDGTLDAPVTAGWDVTANRKI